MSVKEVTSCMRCPFIHYDAHTTRDVCNLRPAKHPNVLAPERPRWCPLNKGEIVVRAKP